MLTPLQVAVGTALRNSNVPNWDKREVAVALVAPLKVSEQDKSDFVRLASDNHYPA